MGLFERSDRKTYLEAQIDQLKIPNPLYHTSFKYHILRTDVLTSLASKQNPICHLDLQLGEKVGTDSVSLLLFHDCYPQKQIHLK
jgi:hypothetical protein